MEFFKNLFGRGREPSDTELNAIFVPLRDRMCDFKDQTGISWAVILPEIQNVALNIMLKDGGVEAAKKVFSAKSIVQHLPNNIPISSVQGMKFSNEISVQEKESIYALVSSIANKMIGEGYPVAHVAQAFSTFAVMTAANVCDPLFAAAILMKSFRTNEDPSGASAEREPDTQPTSSSSWVIVGDEIVRQFEFKDICGPGSKTIFQVRVKIEAGSFGWPHHFVSFMLGTTLVPHECYLIGCLATADEKLSSGLFSVHVGISDDGCSLFIVEEQEYTDKCLGVLCSGQPMKFMILNKDECLLRLFLEKDSSFRDAFLKVRNDVLGGFDPNSNIFSIAKEHAENGDANAQFIVGGRYRFGSGVPRDDAEAVKWFRKAAVQGHTKAQLFLGLMAQDGLGTKQSFFEALNWFQKAAAKGDAQAQFSLGVLYDNGQGVRQDRFKAVQWYQKAALQGQPQAQLNLGAAYAGGEGIVRDCVAALMWLIVSQKNGEAAAEKGIENLMRAMNAAEIEEARRRAQVCFESNYERSY